MDRNALESAAYDLRNKVWKQRVALGIDAGPRIAMLEPSLGASVLGFRFEVTEDLGPGVAGLIDRNARRIAIVRRYPALTKRFTGAHELAHLVMHDGLVMHRDRPIEGLSGTMPREPREAEADYFAACYLMPRLLVEEAFAVRFGTRRPFVVNDDSAHLLSPSDPDAFYNGSLLECAAILAATRRYGRRMFPSLAEEFLVSVKTMAIRLTEIGLI
jgi:Zn-dependent peptidase ImmA (M78 family)